MQIEKLKGAGEQQSVAQAVDGRTELAAGAYQGTNQNRWQNGICPARMQATALDVFG